MCTVGCVGGLTHFYVLRQQDLHSTISITLKYYLFVKEVIRKSSDTQAKPQKTIAAFNRWACLLLSRLPYLEFRYLVDLSVATS